MFRRTDGTLVGWCRRPTKGPARQIVGHSRHRASRVAAVPEGQQLKLLASDGRRPLFADGRYDPARWRLETRGEREQKFIYKDASSATEERIAHITIPLSSPATKAGVRQSASRASIRSADNSRNPRIQTSLFPSVRPSSRRSSRRLVSSIPSPGRSQEVLLARRVAVFQ
jgi:hypothetical protein